MFPYGDNLTSWYRAPVTITLIAAMVVVMLADYGLRLHDALLRHLGFVPVLFSVHPWQEIYTLVTASFVHGDIFHVAGNCLFLWVFGRSLERLFGWRLMLVAFPFLGVVGFLFQWVTEPASPIPIVGASSSIAVMLGAYLALFPRARMRMIFVWLPFWKRLSVPAWAFLAYWLALQLLSLASGDGQVDGVAYAVHVGGFVAGLFGAVIWKTAAPSAEETLLEFTQTAFEPRDRHRGSGISGH